MHSTKCWRFSFTCTKKPCAKSSLKGEVWSRTEELVQQDKVFQWCYWVCCLACYPSAIHAHCLILQTCFLSLFNGLTKCTISFVPQVLNVTIAVGANHQQNEEIFCRIWLINTCAYNSKWKGNMCLINDMCLYNYITTPTNIWAWKRAITIALKLCSFYKANIECRTLPMLAVTCLCVMFTITVSIYTTLAGQDSVHCHAYLAYALIQCG